MLKLAEFYGWEVETQDHEIISQYARDGTETPSTAIPVNDVVRASIVPRVSLRERHDILLDRSKGEFFVRRFGRGFETHASTNLDRLIANYSLTRESPIAAVLTCLPGLEPMTVQDFLDHVIYLSPESQYAKEFKFDKRAPLHELVLGLGLIAHDPIGRLLDALNMPKNEVRSEYVHCIVTTRYRLWVFSASGQGLITAPDYEVYI